MLTSETYMMAWGIYVLATLVGLLILYVWIGGRMGRGARLTLVLLLAGLALTPAHPDETLGTWAPALFVMAFDLLILGTDAAMRAMRPILVIEVLVLAISLLIYLGRRFRTKT